MEASLLALNIHSFPHSLTHFFPSRKYGANFFARQCSSHKLFAVSIHRTSYTVINDGSNKSPPEVECTPGGESKIFTNFISYDLPKRMMQGEY